MIREVSSCSQHSKEARMNDHYSKFKCLGKAETWKRCRGDVSQGLLLRIHRANRGEQLGSHYPCSTLQMVTVGASQAMDRCVICHLSSLLPEVLHCLVASYSENTTVLLRAENNSVKEKKT